MVLYAKYATATKEVYMQIRVAKLKSSPANKDGPSIITRPVSKDNGLSKAHSQAMSISAHLRINTSDRVVDARIVSRSPSHGYMAGMHAERFNESVGASIPN